MNYIEHYILIHSTYKYESRFLPAGNMHDIINLVSKFHIKSEIIGNWLYCFPSPFIGFQLLSIGLWYSFKHEAFVYSGSEKENIVYDESLDEIRARLGSKKITEVNI